LHYLKEKRENYGQGDKNGGQGNILESPNAQSSSFIGFLSISTQKPVGKIKRDR
jgi:hypothetical protein